MHLSEVDNFDARRKKFPVEEEKRMLILNGGTSPSKEFPFS